MDKSFAIVKSHGKTIIAKEFGVIPTPPKGRMLHDHPKRI